MHKINALARSKMIRRLLEGDASRQEIVDETGLHANTVSDEIRFYRREGVVWRSGFAQDSRGRLCIELFSLGLDKKDAKRPSKTLAQLRGTRYRQRQRDKRLLNLQRIEP